MKKLVFGIFFITGSIFSEQIDFLAQALSSFASDQNSAESIYHIVEQLVTGSRSVEDLKKECAYLHGMQSKFANIINDAQLLPINPMTLLPYSLEYNNSRYRILPREPYVLDNLESISILLKEIGCSESSNYVDQNYEIGPILVKKILLRT